MSQYLGPNRAKNMISDNEEATHTESYLTQISHVSGDAADLNKHGNSNSSYDLNKDRFSMHCQEQHTQ